MATAQDVTTWPVARNWIVGQWTDVDATGLQLVYNPATGEVIAEGALFQRRDVARPVRSA